MEDESRPRPDWGNVAFGRRPHRSYADADPAGSRFAIGLVVFVIVALVHPWYAYWVQSRLLAADIDAATQQLTRESAAMSAQWRAQASAVSARSREDERGRRVASVSVRGISEGSDATIVIVDLGTATLPEARDAICAQVQRMRGLGTYDRLQVQRFRGSAPAMPVGSIQCDR